MNASKQYTDDTQYLLAKMCMPTLLKMKPSSLVCVNKDRWDRNEIIKEIGYHIEYFDCQFVVLYENKHVIHLLIYNEKLMNTTMSCDVIRQFFVTCGYCFNDNLLSDVFDTLKLRLGYFHKNGNADDFPHEIGILLGYPLADVEDFIRYHGKNYVVCGCWKVYHNVEEASQLFTLYKEIRRYSMELLENGNNLKDISNNVNIVENMTKKIKKRY